MTANISARFTLINGVLTFATAIAFWLYFPDSVSTAWFLTENERKLAIERVREHETGKPYNLLCFVVALISRRTRYQYQGMETGAVGFRHKRIPITDNHNSVLADSTRHYKTQRLGYLHHFLYSITYQLQLESSAGKANLSSSPGRWLNCVM